MPAENEAVRGVVIGEERYRIDGDGTVQRWNPVFGEWNPVFDDWEIAAVRRVAELEDALRATQNALVPILIAAPLRRIEGRWQWWASICSRHPFLDPECDLCREGDWTEPDAALAAQLALFAHILYADG